MRLASVARGLGVAVALLLVLVFGVPAVAGWVPVAVSDSSAGAPAGTLVVSHRLQGTPELKAGEVVTAELGDGRFITRPVRSVDAEVVTLGQGDADAVQVAADRVRSAEVYRVPLAGHLVGLIAPQFRTLVGRLLALAFLAWAAVEIWELAARARRVDIDLDGALAAAPRRLELTSSAHRIPGTDLVFVPGRPLPSRRTAKQREPESFVGKLTLAVDDLWRAFVGLLSSTIRRHPDAPPRGRHRAPSGARPRQATPSVPEAGTGSFQEIRATVVPEFPAVRETRLQPARRMRALGAAPANPDVWGRKADLAEVEHAARVQDFEARRAAAEAALMIEADRADKAATQTEESPVDPNESPVDRLLREQEAARRAGHQD